MSHWAKIDENNIVIEVTVGNDSDINEGYDWLIQNLGGTWVKTSYNTKGGIHYGPNGEPDGKPQLRMNYAGIGFTYDPILDAFIPPKPDDYVNEQGQTVTFVLNTNTCLWEEVIV